MIHYHPFNFTITIPTQLDPTHRKPYIKGGKRIVLLLPRLIYG